MARVSQTAKEKKYNKTLYSTCQNQEEEPSHRMKESVLSPSQRQMTNKNFYRAQPEVEKETRGSKLSNSPYSKFRYVRNSSRYYPNE